MYALALGIVVLLIIIVIATGSCPCSWPGKLCDAWKSCKCPVCGPSESYKTNSFVGSFDSMKENYNTRRDVAAGTMMSGYQYRSTLPG